MFRAGLGRWVAVAKLGPDETVTCVHWAGTMGRSVELVAVGAGSHVTVFSLRGAADAPRYRTLQPTWCLISHRQVSAEE